MQHPIMQKMIPALKLQRKQNVENKAALAPVALGILSTTFLVPCISRVIGNIPVVELLEWAVLGLGGVGRGFKARFDFVSCFMKVKVKNSTLRGILASDRFEN